jgi:hypothetical protein
MPDDIFLPFELIHGEIAAVPDDAWSTQLSGWDNGELELRDDGTHFGFVQEGSATLRCSAGSFELQEKMYFVTPRSCRINGRGRGMVVTGLGYYGLFMLGGPIESAGRLRYIDGCTDTLLIPPTLSGDPCLNALFFPAHISQTTHTHPSHRVGIVASGRGECRTNEGVKKLFPGLTFIIQADGPHSFTTKEEEMVVIAYHPDSDFGPTDQTHPMINRTIVDGVPAKKLEAIHTSEGQQEDRPK